VDGLSFMSIDTNESIWLEREFEEQEVWEVVKDLTVERPHCFIMFFFSPEVLGV